MKEALTSSENQTKSANLMNLELWEYKNRFAFANRFLYVQF